MKHMTRSKNVCITLIFVSCFGVAAVAAEPATDAPAPDRKNGFPTTPGERVDPSEAPARAVVSFDTNEVVRARTGARMRKPEATSSNEPPRLRAVIAPGPRPASGSNTFAARPSATKREREPREAVFEAARAKMAAEQVGASGRGIAKPEIVEAMKKVPRHSFVPADKLSESYADGTIDIGRGFTMASPFQTAAIADQLNVKSTDRVLELGTGTGYQAAVLSLLAKAVYTVEESPAQASIARVDLERLRYTNNVFTREGRLDAGWPEEAPFDAIVVNSGFDEVPKTVLAQLKDGGRLILPVTKDGKVRLMSKNGNSLTALASRELALSPAPENRVQLPDVRKMETEEVEAEKAKAEKTQ
jgi:protein-L-isoaspartate(D-aspartate) O-methyltransferase